MRFALLLLVAAVFAAYQADAALYPRSSGGESLTRSVGSQSLRGVPPASGASSGSSKTSGSRSSASSGSATSSGSTKSSLSSGSSSRRSSSSSSGSASVSGSSKSASSGSLSLSDASSAGSSLPSSASATASSAAAVSASTRSIASALSSGHSSIDNSASPESMNADPEDLGADGRPKDKSKITIVSNANELNDEAKPQAANTQRDAIALKEEEALKQREKAEEHLRKDAFREELKKKEIAAEDSHKNAEEQRRKASLNTAAGEQATKAKIQLEAQQEARQKDEAQKAGDAKREEATKKTEAELKAKAKEQEVKAKAQLMAAQQQSSAAAPKIQQQAVSSAMKAISSAERQISKLEKKLASASSSSERRKIQQQIQSKIEQKVQAKQELARPPSVDPAAERQRQLEAERRAAQEMSPFKEYNSPRIGNYPVSSKTFEAAPQQQFAAGAEMQAANKFCNFMGHSRAASWQVDKSGASANEGTMRFHDRTPLPDHCDDCREVFNYIKCKKVEKNQKSFLTPQIQGYPVDATYWEWDGKDERAAAMTAARLFCRAKRTAGAVRWAVDKTNAKSGTFRFRAQSNVTGVGEICTTCRSSFRYVICRQEPGCKKARREPLPNPGQFTTPVFQYPGGWNFINQWTFESRGTIVGDFNGDGKSDYARLGATYIHFFISKGDGTFYYPIYPFPAGWNFGWDETAWTSLKATDLNGDGKADIVRTHFQYNHAFIVRGTDGECWNRNGWIAQACFEISAFRYPGGWSFQNEWRWGTKATIQGDFNGDGKGDYARVGATYVHFFISQGNGQFFYPIFPMPNGLNLPEANWVTHAADLNGDCVTDFIRFTDDRAIAFLSQPNKPCWEKNGWSDWSCMQMVPINYRPDWKFTGDWSLNARSFVKGDFNGDGFDDFAKLGPKTIRFFIGRGNGQFYFPRFSFEGGWDFTWDENTWSTLPTNDYDGDGRTDIIRSFTTYNHGIFPRGGASCFLQDGEMASECIKITTYKYPSGWVFGGGWSWNRKHAVITGDFNGDGNGDFINLNGGTYNHQFFAKI